MACRKFHDLAPLPDKQRAGLNNEGLHALLSHGVKCALYLLRRADIYRQDFQA